MKSFCKNLIGILAVGSVLVLGANSALASVTINSGMTSPQTINTINSVGLEIQNTAGTDLECYYNDGTGFVNYNGICGGLSPVYTSITPSIGTYTFIECNSAISGSVCDSTTQSTTLTQALADSGFIDSLTFVITPNTPPPATGLTFFGGTSSGTGTGTMTNTAFVGQVATALGATTAGIYPIVALIAGILVALIITTKIISLYKKTGTAGTKTKEKPLRKTTALYNKDGRYAGVIYD